ncbi:MAG TPA: AAA domain-containing protein [Planctomycetota bacterium]
MSTTDVETTARARIAQVFRYLQELHRIKTPPVVQLDQREWSLRFDALPSTPHVKLGFQLEAGGRLLADSGHDVSGFVLKVARPAETECPEPSVILKNWLRPEYRDVRAPAGDLVKKTLKLRSGARQAFTASEERVEAFAKWSEERAAWAEAALQVANAYRVFSDLFGLYARFERESEKYQLYLADGILELEHEDGPVRHPLLLQRVELRFDPAVPEFCIVDSASPPEVYTPLLRYIGIDGRAIQQIGEAVAAGHFHPLAGESTSGFLRDLAQRFWTDGQFCDDPGAPEPAAGPRIVRAPHLILGNRTYGLAENIGRYLDAIEQGTELPQSLLRIVGVERHRAPASGDEPPQVLLTKPANREQIEVIKRLEETGAVLVQGPPGTGKSHTIGNLIGHLLAQNKSILVTSHASKALRVVREKLAPALQPLCVSVLHGDEECTHQLEESITGIVNTLASTSEKKLDKELQKLGEQRRELLEQQQQLQEALFAAVKDEHRQLELHGEQLSPADVARRLDQWQGKHDWIPGEVAADAELPLDAAECAEIYALAAELTPQQQAMARAELTDAAAFPTPKDFAALLDELAALEKARADVGAELWRHEQQDTDRFPELLQQLRQAVEVLRDPSDWARDCIDAGQKDGPRRSAWLDLAQHIEDCAEQIPAREPLVLDQALEIEGDHGLAALAAACLAVAEHLETGAELDTFEDWGKSDWAELMQRTRVGGAPPERAEHFRALLAELEIRELRAGLLRRWDAVMTPLGAPGAAELGQRPEVKALRHAAGIRWAVGWFEDTWTPCRQALDDLGLDWRRLLKGVRQQNPEDPAAILQFVEHQLDPLLQVRTRQLRLLHLRAERDRWIQALDSLPKQKPLQVLLQGLRAGIKKGDYDAYANAWQQLGALHEGRTRLARFDELLLRLEPAAPEWAKALRERRPPHASGKVPGDVAHAWLFAQWSGLMQNRAKVDLDRMQEKLDATSETLFERTARFVEKSSWQAQLRRTGLTEQQALTGWLQLQKKIGKGNGKHVPRLKEESGRALSRCRHAVPVWIMPLSRVLEFFDLTTTRFDVVILDEASQCDVMGLLALALGREVVVVGDHEQVSPYAVGLSADRIRALIDELLPDVPNRQLYDGKTSVYDLAQQSFGGTIRLLEHFRCVPDIIRFSNDLCYNGEIRALREASSTRVKPALVAHRVKKGVEQNGINEQEAQEIAALVAAVCRLEEYDESSIGVISMVGTDQAVYIDSLLRSRLSTTEYRRRQILCGNASQFQGDERDVIFISMVNSPGDHVLAIRQRDDARKVVNVAASRARDQLWVVHSLDPRRDLKAGDLRLQLIAHAEGAGKPAARGKAKAPRFASDFERDLCQQLTTHGYRVLRHYPVGDGVIELVVEGKGGRRLAVQCDGDRPLTDEEVEQMLLWQLALRRLGWEFIRVRASEALVAFEPAFERLCARLQERGVQPLPAGETEPAEVAPADPLQVKVIRRAEQIRSRWQVPSHAEVQAAMKQVEEDVAEDDDDGDPDKEK